MSCFFFQIQYDRLNWQRKESRFSNAFSLASQLTNEQLAKKQDFLVKKIVGYFLCNNSEVTTAIILIFGIHVRSILLQIFTVQVLIVSATLTKQLWIFVAKLLSFAVKWWKALTTFSSVIDIFYPIKMCKTHCINIFQPIRGQIIIFSLKCDSTSKL